MSESWNEPEAPVTAYGAQRRAAWLASLKANHDMATAAELEAHAQARVEVTRSQHGIFGAASGQDLAATVAARPATVGGDWMGQGREIPRPGAPIHHLEGPALPQADRRPSGRTGPDPNALSSLRAYLEGRS